MPQISLNSFDSRKYTGRRHHDTEDGHPGRWTRSDLHRRGTRYGGTRSSTKGGSSSGDDTYADLSEYVAPSLLCYIY